MVEQRQELPALPSITRLSPLVIRILGGNPSKFALQGTNTYLIGNGKERILLDTGEGKAVWRESLRSVLSDEGCGLEGSGGGVLLTHWHPDHVGGVGDVRSLTGDALRVHKKTPSPGQQDIHDGQVFSVPGATLRAIYCPGHTDDHMAFLLEEESALFTGDNVLGHGTAVFENLSAYMESLEMMGTTPGFEGRAYPGHGEVIEDGKGKVREYISHRKQREEEILGVLGRGEGEGGTWWGSMEIVKVVYKAYPENLHGPAEGGVRQVLRKLEADGKVREDGESGKWSLVGEKAAL